MYSFVIHKVRRKILMPSFRAIFGPSLHKGYVHTWLTSTYHPPQMSLQVNQPQSKRLGQCEVLTPHHVQAVGSHQAVMGKPKRLFWAHKHCSQSLWWKSYESHDPWSFCIPKKYCADSPFFVTVMPAPMRWCNLLFTTIVSHIRLFYLLKTEKQTDVSPFKIS